MGSEDPARQPVMATIATLILTDHYSTIPIPDSGISLLAARSMEPLDLVCASATPYQVQVGPSQSKTATPTFHAFDSFRHPIKTISFSKEHGMETSGRFLAGDTDRYINIFDIAGKRLAGTLICSTGLRKLSLISETEDQIIPLGEQQLAVVNSNGLVEFFTGPFAPRKESDANSSIKSKRKGLTRKAEAALKFLLPGSSELVPVVDVSMQQEDLIVAWASGGIDLSFERIRWRNDATSSLKFSGTTEIIATRKNSTFTSQADKEIQVQGRTNVDESQAVIVDEPTTGRSIPLTTITNADKTTESVNDEVSSSEEEDLDEGGVEVQSPPREKLTNGFLVHEDKSDVEMTEEPAAASSRAESETGEAGEKSFGDLLAERTEKAVVVVDVASTSGPLVTADQQATGPLAATISVATVLSQALRTNDTALLESCLHNSDPQIIQRSVRRLDPSLAGPLVMKLAERLNTRPGRYDVLITWVQWTCVAHGQALATRPEVLKTVQQLYKVLEDRAKTLNPLLRLKGKLDMLKAQMEMRSEIQAAREAQSPKRGHAIYIEGEEQESSDEEMLEIEAGPSSAPQRTSDLNALLAKKLEESEDDDDMPMTNGVVAADASEYDSDEGEERHEINQEGYLDDEAEDDEAYGETVDDIDDIENSDEGSDEEDSDMDDFIDDGPLEVEESQSEVSIDQETSPDPPSKKARRE